MKWAQQAPVRGRERAENIHTILPGLKGPARENPPSESPLQAWRLIISDDISAKIVINKQRKLIYKFHPRFIQPTNKVEVEAFIGLLYLQGIFKSGHEDLKSVWAADGTGLMTSKRELSDAKQTNLLQYPLYSKYSLKTRKLTITPGIFLTLDKMLVPFRGRCSFRMYIPNKPARYGIRIQILADSKTHYMCNAEVYTGKEINKQPKSSKQFKEKSLSHPTQVVMRITEPFYHSKCNLTADNWYTSIQAARMLKEKGLTFVGTMKKNKREIPSAFLPSKARETKSVPTIVHLVDPEDGPLQYFYCILNISGVNSRVLYQFARHGKEISRYNYLKELGLALCYQHVHTRINNNFIPRKIRDRAADIFGIQFTYSQRAEETQIHNARTPTRSKTPQGYNKMVKYTIEKPPQNRKELRPVKRGYDDQHKESLIYPEGQGYHLL
ncbi:hypothetical protein JTB14_025964 [Gonioctena quinquepunctata]|nr:hypothetical protein JTB14_025964 [Gonioctena quinquepunctata]